MQAGLEGEAEDEAGGGARDDELRRHLLRHRDVALAAQRDRLQLELDLVTLHLAGPELEPAQVEVGHVTQRSR